MNIVVRDAKLNDAEGRGYVHYKSWQETYTGLINQEYLDKISIEKRIEAAKSNASNTVIAEVDGNIVGFACYHQCKFTGFEEYGEISAIYVLKKYHKNGIGKMLMDSCIKKLSSYKGVVLWVLDTNINAIDFYRKYGFSFDGGKKDQILITPITELRMVKEF